MPSSSETVSYSSRGNARADLFESLAPGDTLLVRTPDNMIDEWVCIGQEGEFKLFRSIYRQTNPMPVLRGDLGRVVQVLGVRYRNERVSQYTREVVS